MRHVGSRLNARDGAELCPACQRPKLVGAHLAEKFKADLGGIRVRALRLGERPAR
jgi:hypothetical protein